MRFEKSCMRKAGLIFAVLMFVATVSAFPVTIQADDRMASPRDPARFTVEITNNFTAEKTFRVTVSSPKPGWSYVGSAVTIRPGETGTIPVLFTPEKDAIQQKYRFTVYVNAIGIDRFQELTESFTVTRPFDLALFSVEVPDRVRPGQSFTARTRVRNLASSTVSDYRVVAEYMNRTVSKTSSPMIPGGERTIDFNLSVPEGMRPKTLDIRFSLYRGEKFQQAVNRSFEVAAVRQVYHSSNSTDRVLVYEKTLMVENRGNTVVNATLNESVPDHFAPITVFTVEPGSVESTGSSTLYRWDFRLEPGERAVVHYRIDYWLPLVLLGLILLGLLALKRLRRNIQFEKRVEKSESGLKVYVELTNLSDQVLEDLEVEDYVPDVANVREEFETARPAIRKTSDGTRLTWEIDEFTPGEQRVFQYTIEPKVEVEGGITLQGAELREDDQVIATTARAESEFRPE